MPGGAGGPSLQHGGRGAPSLQGAHACPGSPTCRGASESQLDKGLLAPDFGVEGGGSCQSEREVPQAIGLLLSPAGSKQHKHDWRRTGDSCIGQIGHFRDGCISTASVQQGSLCVVMSVHP